MSRFIQEDNKPKSAPKEGKPRKLAGDKGYDYKDLKGGKDIPLKRGK